jgi:hypothetical protein
MDSSSTFPDLVMSYLKTALESIKIKAPRIKIVLIIDGID